MKFTCNFCNYSTDTKFCYEKHLNTKKHKEKVIITPNDSCTIPNPFLNKSPKNEYLCQYCNCKYTSVSNLARHKISCSEKRNLIDEFTNKITELTIKLDEQHKLLDKNEEIIAILKSENAHLKLTVNNAGSIIKTSVSTMSYVIKNYKEAPVLESINDYSAIRYDQDNVEFVDNLIYETNHNKLHIYIGDFIIKTYKKGNPEQQSIWNSDTSRLTYLIREIIANNKVDWRIDKKGIKTTKYIIDPILEYIDAQIRDYIENFDVDYTNDLAREAERKMMKLKSATDILKNIEDKVLGDEILKYIAPHFYLDKMDNLLY